MYDSTCVPHLDLMKLSDDLIRTGGNQYKPIQHHCHYDLMKFNFTNRVIPIWNSLSTHVVSADTVSCFKNRLDKFWSSQIVLCDYKAASEVYDILALYKSDYYYYYYLHGIGNRSILKL